MRHSLDELVALAHYYQPTPPCPEEITEGKEERERRLIAGELAGKKYEIWRAMLRRLREKLPGCEVHDHSFYLQGRPSCDGPFWAHMELPIVPPEIGGDHLTFYLSTLAPYYIILRDLWYYVPGTAPKGGNPDDFRPEGDSGAGHAMSFELAPEEEPYARVLAAEIEGTFGYELMPPEIGKEVVPDVDTDQSNVGESTLYNCFFVGHWGSLRQLHTSSEIPDDPLMKHSTDELFALIHRYYPRGLRRYDPAIPSTEEYRRRIGARRAALAEYPRFRALLARLRARFPGCLVEDQGLYHPLGNFDACHSGKLVLPTLTPQQGQHALYFWSSFLAPYYLLSSERILYVPRGDERGGYREEKETRYDLTAEEQPYAQAIVAEIKGTFGGEPLPPSVGQSIVPEIAIVHADIGHVKVLQALFAIAPW
jgi:hypothetical protein